MYATERFDALFSSHAELVHAYIARRHSGNDVEDLVAEVYCLAWQRIGEIPEGFELPWLYRTAWNLVANKHRKISEIAVDNLEVFSPSSIPDISEQIVEFEKLGRVWKQLDAREQEILRLVAWEELTGTQLAEAIGLSVGGAASALSRARANMRKLWMLDISDSQHA